MPRLKLSSQQWLALAGAACYAACNFNDQSGMSDHDRAVMLELNARAGQLMVTSGLSPTELKDLGLAIIANQVGRSR